MKSKEANDASQLTLSKHSKISAENGSNISSVNKERFTGLQPTKEKKIPPASEVMEGCKNWFPDR